MGICRNMHGKLSYTAVSSTKQVFTVTAGDNRIIEQRPYIFCPDPEWVYEGMWFDMPKFDSFIQAVRFLKEHLEDIL